jgi:hypothetical protein
VPLQHKSAHNPLLKEGLRCVQSNVRMWSPSSLMSMLTVSRSAFNIFISFANDSGCVSLWRNSSVLPHRPKTW